jgi:hypothetical protein
MLAYGMPLRDGQTCKYGCCWRVKGNPRARCKATSLVALNRRHKRRGRASGKKQITEGLDE